MPAPRHPGPLEAGHPGLGVAQGVRAQGSHRLLTGEPELPGEEGEDLRGAEEATGQAVVGAGVGGGGAVLG